MDSREYQKLKEIFHSAREMGADERSAFLDLKCCGDVEVRREVDRLLGSCDSQFLERPAVENAVDLVSSDGLSAGSLVGHYTIVKRIGSGGMGEVYLAEDGKLGRRVAIKILPEMFTQDPERLGRFLQEARAVSTLNHPNILTIHEIGDAGPSRYIATEYIDGETLRSRLDRELSITEAVDIGIQCTSALAAAHAEGIIHRDIKPENIMIRIDGLVKLLDFGLAKLVEKKDAQVSHDALTEKHVRTEPGMIMGTVQYMSPEQTRGLATDARTDIWSLGVVIYEMIAGRPPFRGDTSADLIAEIVGSDPTPLSDLAPGIPPQLGHLVAKALEEDPDKRYQSVKDLLTDLKLIKPQLESSPTTSPAKFRRGQIKTRTPRNAKLTETGQKDLTTVSSAEYFIWGIKSHRLTTAALTLFVIGLIGATAFLVRNYWRGPKEASLAYATEVQLAAQAWEANDLPAMKELLERAKPETGESDLRGFEWGYLSGLYSESMSSRPIDLAHADEVADVAFSPNGGTLATACHDGHIRLWDVQTGAMLRELPRQTGWITSVAFSPDGTRLATTSIEDPSKLWDSPTGSVKLWDAAAGSELFTFAAGTAAAGETAFSPDGTTLFVGFRGSIRLWDTSTGHERVRPSQWDKGGYPMALSSDGKLLAHRADNQTVRVSDVITGGEMASLKGHSDWLTSIAFSTDSKTLATSGKDKTVKLWDLGSKKLLRTLNSHNAGINRVVFTPDGKYVAAGGDDSVIKIWSTETGFEVAGLKGHTGKVYALDVSPDSHRIASGGGSNDNTVKVWYVPQNRSIGSILAHSGDVKAVAFAPNGKLFATGGEDTSAKIWDTESVHEYRVLNRHSDKINAVTFSPDNKTLATGSSDRKIKLWDVSTGRERITIDTSQPVANLAFSPNGLLIASAHWWDGKGVRIWNSDTGQLHCKPESYEYGVWSVAFSKDGKRFLTVGIEDNTSRLWNAATCAPISVFGGDHQYIADFLESGKMAGIQLLNGGRSLRLINTETGAEASLIKGHETEISSFRFSAEGRRLITAGSDDFIKIWDTVSGQELLTLRATSAQLQAIDLSPNGKVLIAGGSGGTVNIFQAEEWR